VLDQPITCNRPIDLRREAALATERQGAFRSLAFNEGSQARLDGRPRSSNPHAGTGSSGARVYWFAGWDSVEHEWGTEASGRHPLTLPREVTVSETDP